MHIISSGYPWGIFLCGLTFFFLMNVFHFCYLKNNKSKYDCAILKINHKEKPSYSFNKCLAYSRCLKKIY